MELGGDSSKLGNDEKKLRKLREDFSKLAKEYERQYELELTRKVNMSEVTEAELLNIIDSFNAKQESLSGQELIQEEKIAYAAVYCLSILYRHTLDNVKFKEIAKKNRHWCKNHETFSYIEILQRCNNIKALRGRERRDMETLLGYAQKYHNNAGYSHAVADLYATVCEDNYIGQKHFRRHWNRQAKKAIRRAIHLDRNYAVYYCTQGRIALIDGQYDKADALFDMAIQQENSAARDGYAIRISRYLAYKTQLRMLRISSKVQEQIDAMKEASVSNIEILAFFSGVVAFLIGSLTLAKEQTAVEAAVLIGVLMGALLFVFSAFTFLLRLNTQKEFKIYVANLLIGFCGIIMMIGGIWYISSY